jgi:hypothetical protein
MARCAASRVGAKRGRRSVTTAGTLVGTTKIRETRTLDEAGNTFSGSGSFNVLDLTGTVVSSGSFTIQGTRIAVERAHRSPFSGASPRDASPCVTNVSQNPKTPHPAQPCPKGHQEWEFVRSDPHRGDPRWYGYVCRGCLPVDQHGCWLPLDLPEEARS